MVEFHSDETGTGKYAGRVKYKFSDTPRKTYCVYELTDCEKLSETKYSCSAENFRTTIQPPKYRHPEMPTECLVASTLVITSKKRKNQERKPICVQDLRPEFPRTITLKQQLELRSRQNCPREEKPKLGINEYRFLACAMEAVYKPDKRDKIYHRCYAKTGNLEKNKDYVLPLQVIYQKEGDPWTDLGAAWSAAWTEDMFTNLATKGYSRTAIDNRDTSDPSWTYIRFGDPSNGDFQGKVKGKYVYRFSFGLTNVAGFKTLIEAIRDVIISSPTKINTVKFKPKKSERVDHAVFTSVASVQEALNLYDAVCATLEPYYSEGLISDLGPAFQYKGCPWVSLGTYFLQASFGRVLSDSFLEVYTQQMPTDETVVRPEYPEQYKSELQQASTPQTDDNSLERVEMFVKAWHTCGMTSIDMFPTEYPDFIATAAIPETMSSEVKPSFLVGCWRGALPIWTESCEQRPQRHVEPGQGR